MGTVLGVAAVVLVSLLFASLWLALYQVIKQQGRLLLRLDELERRKPAQAAAPNEGHLPAQPSGLPEGNVFPPFSLPDRSGRMLSLDDFRNQRVLLIHWNPQCGFCGLIAPELAQLQPDLEKRSIALVLVSHGDADSNRKLLDEHGLRCFLALQSDTARIEPFRMLGTPVAYALDEQGRIAHPLAIGAEAVPALARKMVAGPSRKRLPGERPLSESQILRDGLKPGTPAPRFELPDLQGRTVSLDEYRGRRVLLVFTDPQCGPCQELAPRLATIQSQHPGDGPAVIMVGRGDPEGNRRQAEQHGLSFPMLLQEQWKLSKQYGIFATPVAFLIDENGVIARPVAKGKDEILAIARDAIRLS